MDKILAVQTKIGALVKDKENPFFNSSYFDVNQVIEQLLPLLSEQKLLVIQPLTELNGKLALETLVYDLEKIGNAGLLISRVVPLPEGLDAQKSGSAVTYFRRYSLQSLFLLRAEDDDGNIAKKGKKSTKKEYQEKNAQDYHNNVDPLIDDVEI